MEICEQQKGVIFVWITLYIVFNCVQGRPTLVEEDISIEQSLIRTMSMEITIRTKSWIYGKIPYILDESISGNRTAVSAIKRAMQTIESRTDSCIDFIPKAYNNYDYINITALQSECYSSVGRKVGGQILNLGHGCFTEAIILHELLHALGFWHEHSRTDRDKYVDILYKNIIEGEQSNFEIRPDSTGVEKAVEYDFYSLLHYKHNQFSKMPSRLDTIVPNANHNYIDSNKLGFGNTLSELDVKRIKWLYSCKEGASSSIHMSMQSSCPLPNFAYMEVSPKKSKYDYGDTVKFTCNTGRSLIGGSESTCMSGGLWSGAKPFCILSSTYFIFCDMSDACLSINSYTSNDKFMQIRWRKHPDTRAKIGPGKDHSTGTSSGRYLYIKAEDPVRYRAFLMTSSLNYYGKPKLCLMFYYNMYSNDNKSSLRVLIQGRDVWSNSTSTGRKEWAKAKITYVPPSYRYSLQALFIAEKGSPQQEATVAIDDVFMAPCRDVEAYEKIIDQTENKPREYD